MDRLEQRPALIPPLPARELASPSRGDKLRRALWQIVCASTYRFIPAPFHGARCAILRVFGARIAKGALPYPRARIWAPWNLEMHHNSCIADGVECYNVARVVVGENATVSQRASLCTASHDYRSKRHPLIAADIVIESGAWIAAEAFIGPGVTVANHAVVGARAVVTRSIPANAIVAGNPARVIGMRVMQPLPCR